MFSGETLPKNISLDAHGGPAIDFDAVVSNSGIESRNVYSELPGFEYDVAFNGRLAAERKRLMAFFLTHLAGGKSFRYFDHFDYEATGSEGVFAAIDGSPSDDYQMFKVYTFGALTFYRKITKPINGKMSWSGGGTMDYDTGIITGGTPTTWTGQFHMHARFNTRQLVMQLRDKNNTRGLIVDIPSLPIVEVKTAD